MRPEQPLEEQDTTLWISLRRHVTREQPRLRVLRLTHAPNSRKESNATTCLLPSLSSHSTLVSFLITTDSDHHHRKSRVGLPTFRPLMDVFSHHVSGDLSGGRSVFSSPHSHRKTTREDWMESVGGQLLE